MKLPKLIATDIDGVWTDGGMYYDQLGNEWKKFNTLDSAGVLFARYLKIPVVIITGEDTAIVKRRAEKLKIEHLYMGVKNKLEVLQTICDSFQINLDDVAYIGDDLNDMEVLQHVGFSSCPSSASFYVQEICDHICTNRGGDGVFREFVEYIIGVEELKKIVYNIKLNIQ